MAPPLESEERRTAARYLGVRAPLAVLACCRNLGRPHENRRSVRRRECSPQQVFEGDNQCDRATQPVEGARAVAAKIAEIGERFGDRDLVALGRMVQGHALIRLQRRGEGVRVVDETMVAATTGELSPIVAGIVFCYTICSAATYTNCAGPGSGPPPSPGGATSSRRWSPTRACAWSIGPS